MILADTSVWVEHLRQGDVEMKARLESGAIVMHPYVMGEIALGQLPRRELTLALLSTLPMAPTASLPECLAFIQRHALHGRGIGYVDVHLLASVALAAGARLWTSDKRLAAAARPLGLLHQPHLH